jgi:ribosomal protein S18 acetylase RimI-like enzyme
VEEAADVIVRSYGNTLDARICDDYASLEGAKDYVRSLVETPGCGTLLTEGSFLACDESGRPCGLIVASGIAPEGAMLPQIAVVPELQQRGLGRALLGRTLARLKELGIRRVALTVTEENLRAYDWYCRLGFGVRKRFGAYVWQR